VSAEGTVGDRTTCARHRNVETYLRCGKCGTPICPKCLVHTPVGARCPKCAAPPKSARRGAGPATYALAGLVGLGIGMLGGVILVIVPFGALAILPLLLTGFLVGEAISAVARRWYGPSLAVLAFVCAVVGPLLGRALLIAPLLPVEGAAAKASAALLTAGRSVGGLELLLLLIAGVIAATRLQGR
jgi:hypothetical protein